MLTMWRPLSKHFSDEHIEPIVDLARNCSEINQDVMAVALFREAESQRETGDKALENLGRASRYLWNLYAEACKPPEWQEWK